jgi:hypothetical protein
MAGGSHSRPALRRIFPESAESCVRSSPVSRITPPKVSPCSELPPEQDGAVDRVKKFQAQKKLLCPMPGISVV